MEEKEITSVPGFVAGVVKVGDLLETALAVVGAVCMVYFCVEYFILALEGTDLAQYKAMGKEGDQ